MSFDTKIFAMWFNVIKKSDQDGSKDEVFETKNIESFFLLKS